MNFNDEHIGILEQYAHHWAGLRDVGIMRNLDAPVVKELQRVYNEAVGPERFTSWCSDCVCDLVRLLYTNFESWKQSNTIPADNAGKNGGGRKNQTNKKKEVENGN